MPDGTPLSQFGSLACLEPAEDSHGRRDWGNFVLGEVAVVPKVFHTTLLHLPAFKLFVTALRDELVVYTTNQSGPHSGGPRAGGPSGTMFVIVSRTIRGRAYDWGQAMGIDAVDLRERNLAMFHHRRPIQPIISIANDRPLGCRSGCHRAPTPRTMAGPGQAGEDWHCKVDPPQIVPGHSTRFSDSHGSPVFPQEHLPT